MKKIFYIILDGLGDLPHPDLDSKTPLESAFTPHLDKLAKEGKCGLLYPVGEPVAPESDTAVISLLSYKPAEHYTGRGPLEVVAENIDFKDGDLALRCNFATISDDRKTILDRRAGRNLTTEEAKALSDELNEKLKLESADFVFKNTIGHRAVLVIRSKKTKLSGFIENTDPAYKREGIISVAKDKFENVICESKPLEGFENDIKAQEASKLLNEFTKKSIDILDKSQVNKERRRKGLLPANVILSRDAGSELPKFTPLKEKLGLNFGCFVQMPVEKGIAILTGMRIIEVPILKDLVATYRSWAELAIKEISNFDGLYIHIKGPDEPGHDGLPKKKKEIIELIDKYFFEKIISFVNKEEFVICVTADHATPCLLKAHSSDPVPLLIWGKDIEPDSAKSFSERECKEGALGILKGFELLPFLSKLAK